MSLAIIGAIVTIPPNVILGMIHFDVRPLHTLDQFSLSPVEKVIKPETFLGPDVGKDRVNIFDDGHVCSIALRNNILDMYWNGQAGGHIDAFPNKMVGHRHI